jgi:RNA polymerase sigma factor (sigma-70 family)
MSEIASANTKQENIVFLPNSTMEVNKIVNAVYKQYNKALRAFLVCKLKSKEIEDISQEVYLRLVRHPRLDKLELNFGLLCKIASDIVKDRYRKQNVRKEKAHICLDNFEIMSPELSPEQMVESEEGVSVIKVAIESLDEKSRRIIIFYCFRNLTYEKIGKKMGISISMVRKHILHALQHISKEVEKYYENKINKAPKI